MCGKGVSAGAEACGWCNVPVEQVLERQHVQMCRQIDRLQLWLIRLIWIISLVCVDDLAERMLVGSAGRGLMTTSSFASFLINRFGGEWNIP